MLEEMADISFIFASRKICFEIDCNLNLAGVPSVLEAFRLIDVKLVENSLFERKSKLFADLDQQHGICVDRHVLLAKGRNHLHY